MSVARKKRTSDFKYSDEIIGWLENVAGIVVRIKTEYGGVANLIEDPAWDSSGNSHAVALLTALQREVTELAKEFKSHVHCYQKISR